MKKVIVLLGLIALGLGIFSLFMYFQIPSNITITSSQGAYPASMFFLIDVFTSTAVIIIGIALIYVGLEKE